MRYIQSAAEDPVEPRAAEHVPSRVDRPDGPALIDKRQLLKRRDLGRRETILVGRREKAVLVVPVEGRQLEEEILEVDAHSRFLPEKGTDVESDAHFS
jgi:hypothetical protein